MDSRTFDELVTKQATELRPLALSLTRCTDAANDLCQETIFNALRFRDKYVHSTNMKAWLHTIMRNVFINEYRRKEKKSQVLGEVKNRYTHEVVGGEARVRVKEIQHAIQQLPAVFRTVCLLHLQGYRYEEIACSLNQPLGTIKSRIHFARKMLEKRIER